MPADCATRRLCRLGRCIWPSRRTWPEEGNALSPLPHLFIYYKLPAAESLQWPGLVQAAQMALQRTWPGLACRLMRRVDESSADGVVTWMEIYEHPDGLGSDFEAALMTAMTPISGPVLGPRHTERFVGVLAPDLHPTNAQPCSGPTEV